jgi:hypothetical protein
VTKERDEAKEQRRELSKQRRLEETRRKARKARVRRMETVAVILVSIGGISFLVVNNARKSGRATQDLERLAAASGCTPLQTPADEGRTHTPPYSYKTNPTTSGNHAGQTAPTGISAQQIPDENQTHNLEHGNVGIQYTDLDGSLVDELEKVVRANPTRIFIAPRPQLDANLAFTAWGRLMKCAEPTTQAVEVARKFADAFAGKGPEGDIPGQPRGV